MKKRKKSSYKNSEENDEYNKTLIELKNLRESQTNFFYARKNDLDDDINLEKEQEHIKIIEESLRENDEENYIKENNNNIYYKEEVDSKKFSNSNKNKINLTNKSINFDEDKNNEEIFEDSDEIKENEDDEDSSGIDSIEDLFRKSYLNLNNLTSEIK